MKNNGGKKRLFLNLPLAWKFAGVICIVVLTMGAVTILITQARVSNALHGQYRERALTIARNLAADCLDLLLTDNWISLHQLLANIKATEKDVDYIYVQDAQGHVFAHTFGEEGFPRDLLAANPLQEGQQVAHAHLIFDTDEHIIHELAVAVMAGEAGEIHLGLSEAFIAEKIENLQQELAIMASLMGLLGILVALLVARIINKPLRTLAIASDKIGRGESIPDLPIAAHDEIGRLTATFNRMAANIKEAQLTREHAEERLSASYALLNSLINSIPDLIFYKNHEGVYQEFNEAFAAFVGKARTQIAGKTDHELFSREVADFFREQDHQVLVNGRTRSNEEWVDYPDGRRVLLDTIKTPYHAPGNGRPGIIGVSRDITERKRIEEALRISKDEWEKTFNAIPDIITLQNQNMEIVRVNKAACDFFGMAAEDFIGKRCHEIFREIDTPCQGCPAMEIFRDKLPHMGTIEHTGLGKIFYVATSPILDSQNEVQYIAHIARDITVQKKLEEDLFQAHKMEAIGTLAGGIAHDFNNILTAIIGYAELAKFKLPEACRAETDIEEVLKAGKRAAGLVRQILSFSRKSGSKMHNVSPHLLVKEALKMLRSSLPTTLTIQEDIDPECGQVYADPTNIHQIVINLCTNALHAIEDEKGTVTVSLKRREIGAEEIRGEQDVAPGEFVVLSVADTGCGINEATREHIFEPYFTTKEVGKGTGLGLSVVHGIVKDYKGFCRVESAVGQGSVFHIHIPALDRDVASEEPREGVEPLPAGTGHILVVDDEEIIVEMHQETLEGLGYAVTATTDSLEALAQVRANPDQFDLLLTDQTMPALTGAELAREVLKIRPSMPIILCTGYSSVLSKNEALALGIREYIEKPVTIRELARVVMTALADE